jgi:hypothetical protein
MKRYYILHGDDVRREPATLDEIRAFCDGKQPTWRDDQLARVSLGDDGTISAVALTPDEIKELRGELDELRSAHLIRLLDAALALVGQEPLEGVWVAGSGTGVTVWASEAPWACDVVRAWAVERGLHLHEEPPPTKRKSWSPCTWVRTSPERLSSRDVARIQWPEVDLGEKAIAVEGLSIGVAAAFDPGIPV